jgi:cardiolipin synthase
MVIDSMWATVGSTNLDRRSFELNEELNLVVYNAEIARRLERVFVQDLAESRPVTYEAWRRRGLVARMLETLSIPLRSQL